MNAMEIIIVCTICALGLAVIFYINAKTKKKPKTILKEEKFKETQKFEPRKITLVESFEEKVPKKKKYYKKNPNKVDKKVINTSKKSK